MGMKIYLLTEFREIPINAYLDRELAQIEVDKDKAKMKLLYDKPGYNYRKDMTTLHILEMEVIE